MPYSSSGTGFLRILRYAALFCPLTRLRARAERRTSSFLAATARASCSYPGSIPLSLIDPERPGARGDKAVALDTLLLSARQGRFSTGYRPSREGRPYLALELAAVPEAAATTVVIGSPW